MKGGRKEWEVRDEREGGEEGMSGGKGGREWKKGEKRRGGKRRGKRRGRKHRLDQKGGRNTDGWFSPTFAEGRIVAEGLSSHVLGH